MAGKAKQIYWAVRRVLTQPPGAMVEEWESQTGDRVLPDNHFETLVYYADGPVNLYQLRQWYEPLMALDAEAPAVIVCRSVTAALELLKESPLPVVYAGRVEDLENLVDRQRFSMALYVNQNTRNFQMMRSNTMLHVFISHGESDKSYMVSGQTKAYDYSFIAGEAAAERLAANLINFDVEAKTIRIGRPQLDSAQTTAGPGLPTDDRIVVLYAPTTEGDRPSMRYSSLASHGVAMMQALLASPRHRVIFRPHARTGLFSEEHAAARDQIDTMIATANLADPTARHLSDKTATFDWQLQSADVCIADVSAVVIDWLTTGKPIVVTKPTNPAAPVPTEGFIASTELLTKKRAADIIEVLDRATTDEALAEQRRTWTHHYFGDTTPGAATEAWLAACRRVRAERDDWLSHHEVTTADPNTPTEPHRIVSDIQELDIES
ncbi:MAG: CDP-glycerol glycerophosphotransferase family protein [Actinobacteria bacterium]|nr:CDP-glycerol glycerophosphotransferase family protein [Actinomycetota bacterium]MCB8996371.1 CDP-glycerol glycerophosphotransferase family protein [Actinomycetota bacterium]MCB9414890.1 CDP-glycerol glycerophosphotransferase family protein [Actinomycetota bacterium]HRY10266.1 CDP-glycerol glycerophosphotransferase family protein [Candidatus Nanopelagicales bacterium]